MKIPVAGFRNSAGLALILAASVLAASCASQTEPAKHADSGLASQSMNAYAYGAGFEAMKPQVAKALGDLALQNVSYTSVTASRAHIARSAGPRPAAHEEALGIGADGLHGEGKLSNDPGAGVQTVPILAQNSLPSANGGWRETSEDLFHTYSGMRCPKVLDMTLVNDNGDVLEQVTARLVQIQLYDDAGMDTSCSLTNEAKTVLLTLYASHWPDTTVEDHYGESLKLIVDRFPYPLKSEVPVMVATPDGDQYALSTEKGDALAAAYITEPQDGVTFKTAMWLNKTGGWHVKARATFPVGMNGEEPQLSVVEMMSATIHASTVVAVDKHVSQAQTVSYGN